MTACNFETLGEALYQLRQSYPAETECLVYFKADWCPDCDRATPGVLSTSAGHEQRLLVVDVGPKPGWRSTEPNLHPLKDDAGPWKIKVLPTLCAIPSWAVGRHVARIDKVVPS